MSKANKERSKQESNARQRFLLSFFSNDGYEEKEVNGFWLVKQWNGATETWQVAIFSKDSFKGYKTFSAGTLFAEQHAHLRTIL